MKLCICIPTYNRHQCVEYILKQTGSSVIECNIDYFITDTSDNNYTESVVQNYMEVYKGHLLYEHLDDYNDKTTDLKVAICLSKLADRYDYVYLCGDGLVVDLHKLCDMFNEFNLFSYDLIHFNENQEQKVRIVTSGIDFAEYFGWLATFYGATILSSQLIKKISYKGLIDIYRNTGFLFWKGLMDGIASDNENIIVVNEVPSITNPYKKNNSSYQPRRFFDFWLINWPRAVDGLTDYYNPVKEYIKKDIGNHLGLYRIHNLLRLKISFNLEYSEVRKYKDKFNEVTDTPYLLILAVSCIPVGVAQRLNKLADLIKRR